MLDIYSLDNGFQVVLDNIPYRNSVTVGIWLPIGSRFETSKENGFSHFTEHLLFKGTKTRSYLSISKEIDKLGGYINASTSKEITNYYITIQDGYLKNALDILSDIFYNSIFPSKEFSTEKKVILEEIKMSEDMPDDLLFDFFYSDIYPNHSLGLPIAGTIEGISKSTRSDLYEFYTKKYSPKGAILSIAGSIFSNEQEQKDQKKMIEKYFCKKNTTLAESFPKSSLESPAIFQDKTIKHHQKKLEQTHFIISMPSNAEEIEYNPAVSIFTHLLGGSMSSILFRKLREEKGLCYSIGAFYSKYHKEGLWGVYCGTSNNSFLEAVELVIQEINDVLKNGLDPTELEDSKTGMIGMLSLSLESTYKRAYSNAKMLLYNQENIDLNTKKNKIKSCNADDLLDKMKYLWKNKSFSVTSLGSLKTGLVEDAIQKFSKIEL